ncbi:MAG: hypothetical protein ACE149_15080 [Armatimonadota bacterium]
MTARRAVHFSRLPWLVAIVLALTASAGSAQQGEQSRYDVHLFLADGRPAGDASLRVMGPEGELPPLTANENGHVRVEGLQPGKAAFFLATSVDGRERAFQPVLVVPEGKRVMTLRLYPPGFVTGELLDEKGAPVKGASVKLGGWQWLAETGLVESALTDVDGRFKIPGLIAGAYYSVAATQGPADSPKRTWSSQPFTMFGWDGWYNVGILLPVGSEASAPRPEGTVVAQVVSGPDDEWYDPAAREWEPAVETYDPNRAWAPAPDGAIWIWKAGRPDTLTEKHGATVEFRRLFTVPTGRKVVGYLTIGADDYVAVRLNGQWVGQTNEYLQLATMAVPAGALHPGENELRLTLTNIAMTNRDFYNPTGLTYGLDLIEATE